MAGQQTKKGLPKVPVVGLILLLCQILECSAEVISLSDGTPYGLQQGGVRSRLHYSSAIAPGSASFQDLQVTRQQAYNDEDSKDGDALEILLFYVEHYNVHFDPDFGGSVGVDRDEYGNSCCTETDVQEGICESAGRLRLTDRFDGFHMILEPRQDKETKRLPEGSWMWSLQESGWWITLVTTCSTSVSFTTEGSVVFRSKHGYLPGNMLSVLYLVSLLTISYSVLLVFYSLALFRGVSRKEQSIIDKTILAAIVAGLVELTVELAELLLWNSTATESSFLLYLSLLLGAFRQALGITVWVMLALGRVKSFLVFAVGALYLVLSLFRDSILISMARNHAKSVANSGMASTGSSDLSYNLLVALRVVDAFWVCLILCALCRTMNYLHAMNRKKMLKRYRRFGGLLVFFAATAVAMIYYLNQASQSNRGPHPRRASTVGECLFYGMLAGVAILWWPSAENKDYEHVTELAPLDDNGNAIFRGHETGYSMLRTSGDEDELSELEMTLSEEAP